MTEITNQAEQLPLTPALSLIANRLTNQSKQLHTSFEKDHPIGYHNFTHVTTATSAASLLIDSATRESDPLNLSQQLDQYNLEHQTDFNLDDFFHTCKIAFGLHDTGNICQINQSGQPEYLAYYTANGAEFRSQTNATNLLNLDPAFQNLSGQHQSDVLFFINYLIGHTVYQETDLDKPFAAFVKVCDQIGTICLVDTQDRLKLQRGLINESQVEDPDRQLPNPDTLFNFVHHRFPILVSDDQVRRAILDIWQVSMPPYLTNPPSLP